MGPLSPVPLVVAGPFSQHDDGGGGGAKDDTWRGRIVCSLQTRSVASRRRRRFSFLLLRGFCRPPCAFFFSFFFSCGLGFFHIPATRPSLFFPFFLLFGVSGAALHFSWPLRSPLAPPRRAGTPADDRERERGRCTRTFRKRKERRRPRAGESNKAPVGRATDERPRAKRRRRPRVKDAKRKRKKKSRPSPSACSARSPTAPATSPPCFAVFFPLLPPPLGFCLL